MRRDSSGTKARWRIRRHGDAPSRDIGSTLTELVVTIAIMGVVITPIMNAVMGVIKGSATNRGLAQVETVLNNAADQINRAPKRCDYTLFAQTAAQLQGWDPSAASVVHRRYEPAASPDLPGTWVDGACAGSQPTDLLVQLVVITVRNPQTGAERSIQVVKSDV